jgi:hypothetical protein
MNGRTNANVLDFVRDLDRDRARDLVRALDLIRDRDRARPLVCGHVLACARDLDLGHGRDLNLDHDLDLIRDLVRELDVDLDRDFDLGRAHDVANDLVTVLRHCGERGVFGSDALETDVHRLSPMADRIARQAVKVLPVAHRFRYEEEFRGDLASIAQDGASRPQQFGYAIRVLSRGLMLRAALRGVPPEVPRRTGSD